jgi:AraC-like DNA-binding protein/DNA-binding SARP family transcriptional activator
VPLSQIVEAVWGQDPPRYAVNVVHKHVGALRRVVEPELPRRAQGHWLLSGARGYRVAVDEHTLDLLRFRALVAQAQRRSGRAERLDLFEAALALWRGPVAEDVAGEFDVDPVIAAINRDHASVTIQAAEDALSLGRANRILPALNLAVRLNPTDEVVRALLMRSLASTGQRAAALETFESMRALLADQLGVSPGPVLADAHLDVLGDKVEVASRPRGLPTPRQLPADPVGFVGREDVVRQLASVLRAGPGAPSAGVLTGTAGVGKTTAAVHVAHALADEFPDGQLYIDLRGFDVADSALSPHDVLGRFLAALDIPPDRIPDGLDERAALYRSALAERRVLVVLDNARDSGQVLPLMPGTGPSRIIVTSRRQLRGLATGGVQVVSLDLFDHDQSERFLRSRLSGRRVDAERAAAGDLIEISGGLPLALSLLAARAVHSAGLPLSDIVAAVRNSRASLDAFVDRADPRTNARSVLSWSYASLTAGAARLFTLLAVHPASSVSIDQAAALAGLDIPATRALMDELVEANIAVERAGGRIWRHDLLRQYSSELLASAGPSARSQAEQRLYDHVTPRAVTAASVLSPGRVLLNGLPERQPSAAPEPSTESEAVAWFDDEYEMIMSLVTQAPPSGRYDSHVWQLAWALEHYLDRRGLWQESLAVHEAGLEAAQRSGDIPVRVAMRRGIARAEANLGRFAAAAHEVRLVLRALATQPDADPDLRSETHRQLSWILEQQSDLQGALSEARRALNTHPCDSREPVHAFALNAVGYYEAQLGMYEEALAHCTAALQLLEHSTHRYGLADTWSSLGLIHARAGNLGLAAHAHRRALELFHSLGVRYAEADSSFELGVIFVNAGRPACARHFLEAALQIFDELGHNRSSAVADVLARLDGRVARGRDHGAALRMVIDRHVQANLGDPNLSVATVAARFGISPRTLHKLYADGEHTFATMVRSRRLERAAARLRDAADTRSIAQIAELVGLLNPASFSRAFRREFGVSPRDMRAGARG